MDEIGKPTAYHNLFTALLCRQMKLDFGPEYEINGEAGYGDDDGHIPYDGDDLGRILREDESAIERSELSSCRPFIDICTAEGLDRLKASLLTKPRSDELAQRDRAILGKLMESGGVIRPLRTLSPSWRADLDALERAYQNFSETFDYVRAMGALAELSDRVIVLDPMLLDGEPGSGKSTIVEELAAIVAGGFRRVAMSASETGSQLGGSSSTWANTNIGAVFDALINGQSGNPMFLLDELDRTSSETRYSPLGPLYQLLEPAMSKSFQDLSVPSLIINASRVLWVASSNDRSRIPDPLCQRFTQFSVPYPCGTQSHAVACSVMHRLGLTEPVIRRFTLTSEALALLAKHPPRVMRRLIRIGCGKAAEEARFDVRPKDLPPVKAQMQRMGFFA